MKQYLLRWKVIFGHAAILFFVVFLTYQPHLIHGFIDYYEAGKDLVCVNEVFFGKIPYREIYLQFGPLNIYLDVFFMLIFGKHLSVLRMYFYFGTVITLITAYLISFILCKRKIFAYLAALILIISTYHPFWATRWGGARFAFSLIGLLYAIRFFKDGEKVCIFLSGIFASAAFLMSFEIGIFSFTALILTISFYAIRNRDGKSPFLFIGSVLAALCPFFIYFGLHHALLPYLDVIVNIAKMQQQVWVKEHINLWNFSGVPQVFQYSYFSLYSQRQFILIFYAFTLTYLIYRLYKRNFLWTEYSIMTLLIYGWLIMKFKACTMREIIGPQFQVALQPAIILVCVFLGDLAGKITVLSKRRSGRKDLIKLAGMTAVFVFGLIYSVFSEKVFYGELSNWLVDQRYKANIIPAYSNMIPFYRAGLVPLNIDRASGIMVSPQQAEEIEGVTGYILSVTTPGEPIFTFPELGIYNFFTDRPCVSRFNIPTCIWATPKWGQEIINDLKTRQPRYIIYGNRLSNITKSLGDKKELLPEVGAYINGNYVKVASFGKIDVLKRK